MALSRYGGITGTKKISEDFENINTALNNVAAENDGIKSDINRNKQDLEDHKNSTNAHLAQHIPYSGAVIGASNTKQALDNLKQEVNDLVLGSGDSGPEVAAARGGYPTLGDRLDAQSAETTKWQRYKLTRDTGVSLQINDFSTPPTSFNDINSTGEYYVGAGLSNHPLAIANNGFLSVRQISSNHIMQVWTDILTNKQYVRSKYQSSWSSWAEIVNLNKLGELTQVVTVTTSAAQSLANNTSTPIIFGSITTNDFAILESGRIKITKAGTYEILLTGLFAANANGSRSFTIHSSAFILNWNAISSSGTGTRAQGVGIIDVNANTLLDLTAYQSSGVALDLSTANVRIRKVSL